MGGDGHSLDPLLRRQLRRIGATAERPPEGADWLDLLRRIDRSYRAAAEDRYIIERAMEISSRELADLNRTLREERDKLQMVASDGLCQVDAAGLLVSVNSEGARLLGLAPRSAVGNRIFDVVEVSCEGGRCGECRCIGLGELIEAGEAWSHERAELRHRGGGRIPVTMALNPVRLDGRVTGSMIALRDRTQQRQDEQRLLEANRKLSEARDQAQAASEAKSRFLATMSHEIRTPMHGVLGTLDLLLDTPLGRSQFELADTALRSAERLLAILDDVLDFSKIEAGQLSLETVEFELREEVESALELYADSTRAEVELCSFVADEVPEMVVGDPLRLRQVLTNLVGNAVKFTAEGQVVLRVDPAPQGAGIRFTVDDSGAGMTVAEQQRVFEAFVQADGSTTRQHGGTGLGLAICQDLVTLMGGRLQLESGKGQGARFWFDLDLPAGDTEVAPLASLAGLRVLLVKNQLVPRQIVECYLRSWQAEVDVAVDADAALQQLGRSGYDVLLVDDTLPGAGGFDLARRVHAVHGAAAPASVLMVSSGADCDSARQAGAAATLTKPVGRRTLHQVVRGLRHPAEPAPTRRSSDPADPVHFLGRILLVEDNPVNQRVAAAILSRFGLSVDIAQDGAEGVAQSGSEDYDLILMDCHMPQVDGYEATRRIRAREAEQGGRVPVVAMTASAMTEDRARCLQAGMDDHLPKPATRAAIAEVLGRWLPKSSGATADPGREAR